MDFWVTKLREQAAQIAAGEYSPGAPAFTRGPAGVFELSQELDTLARLMTEREADHRALSHEVHHRVKNNLQIVTSLLTMQMNAAREPVVRDALGQARARMGALALIHRMLYEQSDFGSRSTIDIDRLMTELCTQLRLWHRDRPGIEFGCEASAIAVPLDSAMPLTLLAVEAVTNAYAHAFPDDRTGRVVLHFSVTEHGEAVLAIADDGIGFDCSGDIKSMGFQLIRGFAHQLGGKLEISSVVGAGTEVRLEYRADG
jgi:two-component sensor histidine kinase